MIAEAICHSGNRLFLSDTQFRRKTDFKWILCVVYLPKLEIYFVVFQGVLKFNNNNPGAHFSYLEPQGHRNLK